MDYLLFIYSYSVIIMAFTLGKIYFDDKSNNNLLFTLLSTYLLNLVLPIFLFYFNNLWLSTINSILLAISAIWLFVEIKKATGTYKLLALPYVLVCIFAASAITTTLVLA